MIILLGLRIYVRFLLSVIGVGIFRACGGEGDSDDQDVFCTTGPYFHVHLKSYYCHISGDILEQNDFVCIMVLM